MKILSIKVSQKRIIFLKNFQKKKNFQALLVHGVLARYRSPMKEPPKGVGLNRAILRQQDGPNVKSNPGGAVFHGRAVASQHPVPAP